MIDKTESMIQQELNKLTQMYPNYEFTATLKPVNPKKEVRKVVAELKSMYPEFKFSLANNTYSCLDIINVSSKEDISYYGGDSCGFIGLKNYNDLYETIKNKLGRIVRVNDFIEGTKKCYFEIR